MAQAIRRRSRGQRTTEKQFHKVVALTLGCGNCPELHLKREVSKSIWDLLLMYTLDGKNLLHDLDFCSLLSALFAGATAILAKLKLKWDTTEFLLTEFEEGIGFPKIRR